MRVVSANLQHGVPTSRGQPDLSRALGPLADLAGDVYGFQELDRARARTRWEYQAERLAGALGGELVSGRGKRVLLGSQDNALVVRGEVVEREVVVLPGSGERRVLVAAVVVVGGHRWTVASMHLSLVPDVAVAQLDHALDVVAERPKPWVVMGDLNLVPDQVAPIVDERGLRVIDGPPTVDARRTPTRRLDHILLDGAHATGAGVAALPVSDHLAVWADLDVGDLNRGEPPTTPLAP